jgi:hypothetical protein
MQDQPITAVNKSCIADTNPLLLNNIKLEFWVGKILKHKLALCAIIYKK